MKYQAQESMFGLMVKRMKENGLKIKCMATENFGGKMASNTVVSSKMIREKEEVPLHGEMVVFMRVNGVMVNSTVKVCS